MENNDRIEALIRSRMGGVYNIRGISFQIFATMRQLLRMCGDNRIQSVCPEGVEDYDTHWENGRVYTQVKTANKAWNISNLDSVVDGFLPLLLEDPKCRFRLMLNHQPGQDIRALISRDGGTSHNKALRKFTKRVQSVVSHTHDEIVAADIDNCVAAAEQLLERLSIEWSTETGLRDEIIKLLHDTLNVSGDHAEHILLVLFSKTIDSAQNKQLLDASDVQRWHVEAVEAANQLVAMADIGVLVSQAQWDSDAHADDFYDGKSVGPSHIQSGLDVPRPKWIERIGQAWVNTNLCVIRSASGQGKTTLALRYAYDSWPRKDTYIVRSCKTVIEAEKIRRWLRFRKSLGLPTMLICEGDPDSRCWTQIAQDCAELQAPMLVAVRREDWVRFAEVSRFNYELVDPALTLEEARGIHVYLKSTQRLHPQATTPEEAFEKAGQGGEEPLLMEFIHLLTQGQTLRERLGDQVRLVKKLGEDPAKLDIVRLVTVAHGLGASIDPSRLMEVIDFRDDANMVLEEVDGEYVNTKDGQLSGLHHVRSRALREILHGPAISATETAARLLLLIDDQQIQSFSALALSDSTLDADVLLNEIVKRAVSGGLQVILAAVEGCFEAGERKFFDANAAIFDRAVQDGGSYRAILLIAEIVPIGARPLAQNLKGIFGDKHSKGIDQLIEQANSFDKEFPRGIDLARRFLEQLFQMKAVDLILERGSAADVGLLFDWIHVCNIKFPDQSFLIPQAWNDEAFELPIEDFCQLARGIGRLAPEHYANWCQSHEDDLRGYFMLHLDCTEIIIDHTSNLSSVNAVFIPDGTDKPHNQAMRRIDSLRMAMPHMQRYDCRGDWALVPMMNELPSLTKADDTVKHIPAENLPHVTDISKNALFRGLVEARYVTETYYRFENQWYELREAAREWCRRIDQLLRDWLNGKAAGNQKAIAGADKARARLSNIIVPFPIKPPAQAPKMLRDLFETSSDSSNWVNHLLNFLNQYLSLFDLENKEFKDAWIAAVNAKTMIEASTGLGKAFDELAKHGPIYCDFAEQEKSEQPVFKSLLESTLLAVTRRRLGGRTLDETRTRLKQHHAQEYKRHADEIMSMSNSEGVVAKLPEYSECERLGLFDNRYPGVCNTLLEQLPVVIEVEDSLQWDDQELIALLSFLQGRTSLADMVTIVATKDGCRLQPDSGLSIYSHHLNDDVEEMANSLLPLPLSREILPFLPPPIEGVNLYVQNAYSLIQFANSLKTIAQNMSEAYKASGRYEQHLLAQRAGRMDVLRQQYINVVQGLRVIAQQIEDADGPGQAEEIVSIADQLANEGKTNFV